MLEKTELLIKMLYIIPIIGIILITLEGERNRIKIIGLGTTLMNLLIYIYKDKEGGEIGIDNISIIMVVVTVIIMLIRLIGGTAVLAGIVLKIGGYGLIRYSIGLLPVGAVYNIPLVLGIGVISIIIGILQKEIKRIKTYTLIGKRGPKTISRKLNIIKKKEYIQNGVWESAILVGKKAALVLTNPLVVAGYLGLGGTIYAVERKIENINKIQNKIDSVATDIQIIKDQINKITGETTTTSEVVNKILESTVAPEFKTQDTISASEIINKTLNERLNIVEGPEIKENSIKGIIDVINNSIKEYMPDIINNNEDLNSIIEIIKKVYKNYTNILDQYTINEIYILNIIWIIAVIIGVVIYNRYIPKLIIRIEKNIKLRAVEEEGSAQGGGKRITYILKKVVNILHFHKKVNKIIIIYMSACLIVLILTGIL